MKLFFIKGGQFSVLLLLFYVFSLYIFYLIAPTFLKKNISYCQGTYGFLYSRINDAEKNKDIDILFLGSSTVYRGFDPRVFDLYGYKTFNFGSSGQTHTQTNLILRRYLKRLNPKLVVYEVYPGVFASDGIESSIDLISNAPIDLGTVMMVFENMHIKTLNTLIIASINSILGQHRTFQESPVKGDDLYIENGFVEKELKFFSHPKFNAPELKFEPKIEQFNSFKTNLDILEKNQTKYVLVRAPNTSFRNEAYKEQEIIDSIFSEMGNYYNFNKILNLNDSLHFYDAVHLNINGTEKFNKELIQKFEEDGVF